MGTKEYVNCPECSGALNADHPNFVGDGTMIREIGCEDCTWQATETWVLDVTNVN